MAEVAAQVGPWVAIVALLLGIVNTVSQWVSKPGRELKDAVAALENIALERFKEHDRRIQKMEDWQPHQPTKNDLHGLSNEMVKLGTKMEGLAHVVDRMDRHLREVGK